MGLFQNPTSLSKKSEVSPLSQPNGSFPQENAARPQSGSLWQRQKVSQMPVNPASTRMLPRPLPLG